MQVLSILPPAEVEELGQIPGNAVCGKFTGEENSVENFVENTHFVDFMHAIIQSKAPTLLSFIEAAKNQKNGYLYLVDFRTPEGIMGNVPSEDIIGAFQIENEKIVENSYFRNPYHKIYTKNSLFKLEPGLFNLLIEEIKSSV